METFSALLAICAGNSPVPGEFPAQRPVTRSFDVFFDLRLNKRLSKQSWGWWFETLSRPLWRHRDVCVLSRIHAEKSLYSEGDFIRDYESDKFKYIITNVRTNMEDTELMITHQYFHLTIIMCQLWRNNEFSVKTEYWHSTYREHVCSEVIQTIMKSKP